MIVKSGLLIALYICWISVLSAQPHPHHFYQTNLKVYKTKGTEQTKLFDHWRDSLLSMDTSFQSQFFQHLSHDLPSITNQRQKCRSHQLLGLRLHYTEGRDSLESEQSFYHLNKAIELAYGLEDQQLLSELCRWISQLYNDHQKIEPALWYGLKSIELAKSVGFIHFPSISLQHWAVGEWLYKTRNYQDAITYLEYFNNHDDHQSPELYYLFANNTLGLSHQNLKQYDTAYQYYTANLKRADSLARQDWLLITQVNLNNLFLESGKFDTLFSTAKHLMNFGDSINDIDLVAISKYLLGVAFYKKGQVDHAEQLLLSAKEIMEKSPYPEDAINIYKYLGELYLVKQNFEKALYYTGKYRDLESAKVRLADNNRYEYLQAKLALETNQERLLDLQRSRKAARTRWILLLGIVISGALVGLLLINRKKIIYKHNEVLLKEKNLRHQAVIEQAHEQLRRFTDHVIEKNALIDQLHSQLISLQSTKENELLQKTILTEEEWDTFKTLFDKTHPGFLEHLQQLFSDITKSELRMAALIYLNIDHKDMAAMQGISVDSVRKNRQRLRERLSLKPSQDIKEYLIRLSKLKNHPTI